MRRTTGRVSDGHPATDTCRQAMSGGHDPDQYLDPWKGLRPVPRRRADAAHHAQHPAHGEGRSLGPVGPRFGRRTRAIAPGPSLTALLRDHPDLEIELVMRPDLVEGEHVAMGGNSIDLAVRAGLIGNSVMDRRSPLRIDAVSPGACGRSNASAALRPHWFAGGRSSARSRYR